MEFFALLPAQQFKKPTSDSDLPTAALKFTPKDPGTRLNFSTVLLTNICQTTSGTVEDSLNFQQYSVYKLARANFSFLWSFSTSSLPNNSRSQLQILTCLPQPYSLLRKTQEQDSTSPQFYSQIY